jgi:hypothetical protein
VKKRIAQQKYDDNLRRQYITTGANRAQRYLNRSAATTKNSRSELTEKRAKIEGVADGADSLAMIWINLAPWRETMLTNYLRAPQRTGKKEEGQPELSTIEEREKQVRTERCKQLQRPAYLETWEYADEDATEDEDEDTVIISEQPPT